MPVKLVLESRQTVNWEAVETREDLILARMQQLDHRRVSESIVAGNLRNSRKANKIYFDQHHRLRPQNQQLHEGDFVLLYDSSLQKNRHTKLNDRWRGPFRIVEKLENSIFYRLKELDGTPLSGTATGDRVKKFYMRRELEEILGDDDIRGSKETLTNNAAGEDLEEELTDEEPVQSDGNEQAGVGSNPTPIVIKRW